MSIKGVLTALAATLVAAFVAAPANAAPLAADIAIVHANVLSPPAAPVADQTILIKGDKIIYVGPSTEFKAARTIDATRRYVMPGMIDAHVHLSALDFFKSDEEYWKWADTDLKVILKDYLSHGFTSLLSVGDYWPNITKVRDRIKAGALEGPNLYISGPILAPPGGHGMGDNPTCMAIPYCKKYGASQPVADAKEARRMVRELAAAKVDGIKVALQAPLTPENMTDASDAAAKIDFGTMHLNKVTENFAPGVLEAIVKEAHAHKLPVRAHTGTATESLFVINAGVDALVHSPGVIDGIPSKNTLSEVIALSKKRGIPMATTINASLYLPDDWGTERFLFDGSTGIVPFLKAVDAPGRVQRGLRQAMDAGIPFAFGVDRTIIKLPSDGIGFEFQLLRQSGVTQMEALTMATSNAANYLNQADRIGSVTVGKQADLIILSGNPLEVTSFLDRVDVTLKGGKVVWTASDELARR